MSTSRKKKRGVVPEGWPPSAVAEALRLNAEAWMREPEPDDPEAKRELKGHRLAIVKSYSDQLAKHRGGKPRGALKPSTIYVHAWARHPGNAGLTAKMLWKKLPEKDRKKLGRMTYETFRDHVTNARRGK